MTNKHSSSSTPEASDASVLNREGLVLSRSHGKHEAALGLFERAAQLDPADFSSWFNIGATCRFLGRLADAEAAWDRAIDIRPDDGECQLLRSQLKRQTRDNNHIAALEERLKNTNLDVMTRVQLLFALAKENEDLENYDVSFRHLQSGAALRRRHMQYDVNADLQIIDHIIDVYRPETMNRHFHASNYGAEAIFILGMPRTGSTLIERIIGSHPDVRACGELHNFAAELVGLCKQQNANIPDRSALVDTTAQLDFRILGQQYLESVRKYQGDAPRFTDKMPLNFLYCGLIRLALPGATIIHVRRHPIDTIYSMYKQLFNTAYPMSYDLTELARYYCTYRKLMDHWHNVCPDKILSIDYDDLLADQAGVTRTLIEACGLDWNESCLHFEHDRQATTTASAAQVREAIYSTSSGRWRKLQKQLAPAIEYLKKSGIEIGA